MVTPPRQGEYLEQLQGYARVVLVDGYSNLVRGLWRWDHSSTDAYLRSVEGRRQAWRDLLAPPSLTVVADPEVSQTPVPGGRWLSVPLAHGLTAQGLLVVPEGARHLVVFVHGLGSTPERAFGLGDDDNAYDRIAQRMVDAGYAVLAPMNLTGIPERNQAQSICRLAGTTVEGLEFVRTQRLLEAAAALYPELDLSGYALAGMSWGGLAAQWWAPLDPRVCAAASIGFFNDRPQKMLIQDPQYETFRDTGEHHAFIGGMLLGFSDAETACLICPRPFLVQHGMADRIGRWPQVAMEFERARAHWSKLGVEDRVELQLHPGGHVVRATPVVDWLSRHFAPR